MKPQLLALPVAIAMFVLALVVGMFRLLNLQGLMVQPPLVSVFPFHGEVMVFGFLAVLIATERYLGSLPFKLHPVVHVMPFLVALGAVLKLVGSLGKSVPADNVGSILIALGMAILIYLLMAVSRQSAQPLPFRYMSFGAFVLLLGALFSIGGSPVRNMNFSLFLLGFPILTILGERVELSRFLSPAAHTRMEVHWWVVVAAYLSLLVQDGRWTIGAWAVLMALVVLPLLKSELALVRAGETSPQKLHRYLGRSLLVAYLWLFAGLALVLAWAATHGVYGGLFDASIHSLAAGFVLTMIFAHGPVIAPALFRVTVKQEKLSTVPLGLLTVANLMRVGGYAVAGAGLPMGGDIVGVSGFVALAALLAFVIMMARSLSLRPA